MAIVIRKMAPLCLPTLIRKNTTLC